MTLLEPKIAAATTPEEIDYLTDLMKFFSKKAASYERYSAELFDTWNINDPSGIKSASAVQEYISWELHVVLNFTDPIYLLIAMLPCERLWAYLGDRLSNDPNLKCDGNLYQFWIDGNCSSSGAEKMESFLEVHRSRIDLTVAHNVYNYSMECELNFFLAATGDYPVYPTENPQGK